MKHIAILIFSFFIIKNTATAQTNYGSLEGKMMDKETKEGLIAASVTLYKAGEKTPVNGTSTDINGVYSIDSIPVGVYDVEFSYVGYKTIKTQKIEIKAYMELLIVANLVEEMNFEFCSFDGFIIPLFSSEAFGTGTTYSSHDIRNMPIKW